MEAWDGFKGTKWQKDIDIENFIEMNYTEYLNDESFLSGISKKTSKLWKKCESLIKKEEISGTLDVETDVTSGIDNFNPGYIDRKCEVIVGLQTDEPLKRIVNLYSGVDGVNKALDDSGFRLDSNIEDKFNEYRKTYEVGINEILTNDIKKMIDNYLLLGLPISYGRGRIIGDYRRLVLYGSDYLILKKEEDINKLSENINSTTIRLIEEVKEQIKALKDLTKMASRYDIDISKPAKNAKEAVEWLYLAYLGAVKQSNGYSMGIGRNTTFLDIYIERDLKKGIITEEEAQELIDQLVIKLRLVRHLRNNEYNDLFATSPLMITESIGGMLESDKSLITKTSYRMLNTLNNLGVNPEPNMVILWSSKLNDNFKKFATKMALTTNCVQFANDDIMRKIFGVNYTISGGTSAMMLGSQTQLYGSNINLAKTLLYALNGGKDEITGQLVIDGIEQINGDYLDYDTVIKIYDKVLKKVCKNYVDALNIIHYMQDKYSYESCQMSLHDTLISRVMSFGITGLSTVVDSLSAIKYGKVRVTRNKEGLTKSFDIDTEYPLFGNNDDRVDQIAVKLLAKVYQHLKKNSLYRNAEHTLSIVNGSMNILYGKHTGATPNGRRKEEIFPVDVSASTESGVLATLSSIAKLPYKFCLDGIVNTMFVDDNVLGSIDAKTSNLSHILDGYFKQGGQHLNVQEVNKEKLKNLFNNPNKDLQYIVSLSDYNGYFNKLSKEQQEEVLSRKIKDTL